MSDTASKPFDANWLKARIYDGCSHDCESNDCDFCQHTKTCRALLAANQEIAKLREREGRLADHLEQWNRLVGELGSPALAASTNCLLVETGRKEVFVEQRFRDGYDERNRKAERTEKAEAELAALRKTIERVSHLVEFHGWPVLGTDKESSHDKAYRASFGGRRVFEDKP